MHGENGRHKRAAPQRACHLLQRNKKQEDPDTMEQHIGEVVPAGLQSMQLAVKHVRNCRQRVPVLGMNVSECPSDVRDAYAVRDSCVLIDVTWIVVVHEIML